MKNSKVADARRKSKKPTRAELERRRLRDHARLAEAWRRLINEVTR